MLNMSRLRISKLQKCGARRTIPGAPALRAGGGAGGGGGRVEWPRRVQPYVHATLHGRV
jgi:hypothetical protein